MPSQMITASATQTRATAMRMRGLVKIKNRPAEKVVAPSSTQTGRVKTQARRRFRRVFICRPERLAAMVPATPLERTWVVLTGRPMWSASQMVHMATSSAEAPWA